MPPAEGAETRRDFSDYPSILVPQYSSLDTRPSILVPRYYLSTFRLSTLRLNQKDFPLCFMPELFNLCGKHEE